MPRNPDFQETIIDTLIRILKENQHFAFFRAFYYGDPIKIPSSNLPCIIIEPVETEAAADATGLDSLQQVVEIKLAYDKKNDFGKAPNEVYGVRKLQEFAEGLDPASNIYDDKTIVGILRKNFTLGNIATNQQLTINYGVSPRPDDMLTQEAIIRFVVNRLIEVESRT